MSGATSAARRALPDVAKLVVWLGVERDRWRRVRPDRRSFQSGRGVVARRDLQRLHEKLHSSFPEEVEGHELS